MPGPTRVRPWARSAAGAAIVGGLVWWLGVDPFLDPVRRVDGWTLTAAAAIAVPTTVCCAWRWQVVSRALGTQLRLGPAVSAYYRSQFLNTVLPGGVLGDVERAARRGRVVRSLGHAVRAVAWERGAGQAVQLALTIVVLLVLPSPVRGSMPLVAAATVAGALAVVLVLRRRLLPRAAWPALVVSSTVVVTGHVATFVIAARAAGTTGSVAQLVPLGLLVLLVGALPVSIAGWGPREAGAAGVFAMAGLGAGQGVSVAVMYGVLVIVATLPGAVVLLLTAARPRGTVATGLPVPKGVARV